MTMDYRQPDLFSEPPPPRFDLSAGEALKIAGMQLVLTHQADTWSETARALMLLYIRTHGPCLMEQARAFALQCRVPQPTHPNAWGAASGALSKAGQIEMVGEWRKSESEKSHARIQPMWRAKA
jgi:hypothetical protein